MRHPSDCDGTIERDVETSNGVSVAVCEPCPECAHRAALNVALATYVACTAATDEAHNASHDGECDAEELDRVHARELNAARELTWLVRESNEDFGVDLPLYGASDEAHLVFAWRVAKAIAATRGAVSARLKSEILALESRAA